MRLRIITNTKDCTIDNEYIHRMSVNNIINNAVFFLIVVNQMYSSSHGLASKIYFKDIKLLHMELMWFTVMEDHFLDCTGR